MSQLDYVVFDLGAVLIDWNPRYVYRRIVEQEHMSLEMAAKLEDKIEVFLREVATGEWNSQMDAGTLFQKAIDERAKQFPDWHDWLQQWRHEWPTMMRAQIDETVDVFEAVCKQRDQGKIKGVYALSNWEANTFKIARARFPFLEKFDGRLISGEEKLIKPDPAFFRLLESRHSVVPQRAIFIDDLKKNTAVAESLGYHVHEFKSGDLLRDDLQKRGAI